MEEINEWDCLFLVSSCSIIMQVNISICSYEFIVIFNLLMSVLHILKIHYKANPFKVNNFFENWPYFDDDMAPLALLVLF